LTPPPPKKKSWRGFWSKVGLSAAFTIPNGMVFVHKVDILNKYI
jgi:hypothetical protein